MLAHPTRASARVRVGATERARLAAERRRRVMARAENAGPRRRRRTLAPGEIVRLVTGLRTWNHARSPLSWRAVVDFVQGFTGHRFSRQALESHAVVKKAFQEARDGAVRKGKRLPKDPALAETQKRAEHLVAENRRLRDLLAKAEERFVRWAYNAHRKGVTEKHLEEDLHKVDRGQTDPRVASGSADIRQSAAPPPVSRRASSRRALRAT